MRIQLPGEFLNCLRALVFLLYSFGVLGVGSESVMYLPESNEPPDLVCNPTAILTGAMLPLDVPPELAPSSIISLALIGLLQILGRSHSARSDSTCHRADDQ